MNSTYSLEFSNCARTAMMEAEVKVVESSEGRIVRVGAQELGEGMEKVCIVGEGRESCGQLGCGGRRGAKVSAKEVWMIWS